MQKNYIPQPIDTSDIQLPKELNLLLEQIAKNVHEEWSKGRMEEGWTYGKERNDVLKQHPCLIPYEELPEVEKNSYRHHTFAVFQKYKVLASYQMQFSLPAKHN